MFATYTARRPLRFCSCASEEWTIAWRRYDSVYLVYSRLKELKAAEICFTHAYSLMRWKKYAMNRSGLLQKRFLHPIMDSCIVQ